MIRNVTMPPADTLQSLVALAEHLGADNITVSFR